jgi:hypothetical protein
MRAFYRAHARSLPPAHTPQARGAVSRHHRPTEDTMSKGLDKKKEQKKKPAKSLKEKRAEKSEKKAGKN